VRTFDANRLLTATGVRLASGIAIVLFFALTAAIMDIDSLFVPWLPVAALLAVRFAAKAIGVAAFGPLSGISLKKSLLTGLALTPMSALALMLIQQVSDWNPPHRAADHRRAAAGRGHPATGGALALALVLRRGGEARTER